MIGRLARGVRAEDAYKFILGYTCGNDVTLRDLQKKDDQWARAKGFDGSAPLGPWIETELDPNDAIVRTRLNGEIRQQASTSEMVFGVATLIEYVTDVHDAASRSTSCSPGRPRGSASSPAETSSRSRSKASACSGTRCARERQMPIRPRPLRLDPRRECQERPVLVARRPSSRRCLRAPGRGHGHEPSDRRGLPRGPRRPPVARPHLGRGSRRRRPLRPVPAVRTAGHLSGDDREAGRGWSRVSLLVHRGGARRATESSLARGEAPGYDGRCRERPGAEIGCVRGGGETVRDPVPDAGAGVDGRRPGEGRGSLGAGRPPRLRDRALRRVAGVPARRRRRRHADGDHARRARGRPPGERPAQRGRDRGARGSAARVRTPAAGARSGLQAPVQAARRHERGGLPRAGVPAGGDGELPRAPRMGEGRPHHVPLPRRARRGFRSHSRVAQPGRLRHAEARMDEQPLHPVPRRGGAGREVRALPHGGGAVRGPGAAAEGDPDRARADEDALGGAGPAPVPVHGRHHAQREGRGPDRQGPRGIPQGGGRGARCPGGMGHRADPRDAGRAGLLGRPEPDEGVAAGSGRGDGVERVATRCRSRLALLGKERTVARLRAVAG